MMEGKRMRTIDTVYEAWQEDFYRREDPEEIEEVYRYFQLLIRNLEPKMADKLWDAMTICQKRAAEIAFKDGYRMGYNLHKEMEVRRWLERLPGRLRC